MLYSGVAVKSFSRGSTIVDVAVQFDNNAEVDTNTVNNVRDVIDTAANNGKLDTIDIDASVPIQAAFSESESRMYFRSFS